MSDAHAATLRVCANGPYLVRNVTVVAEDGTETHHDVVALCRCGKSALKPLCDGSHKVTPRRTRKEQTAPDSTSDTATP